MKILLRRIKKDSKRTFEKNVAEIGRKAFILNPTLKTPPTIWKSNSKETQEQKMLAEKQTDQA